MRTAAIFCLAIWLTIWVLFMALRLSVLDSRNIPGAGLTMLGALATTVLAPIVATGLAGAALFHQPRVRLNLLVFGCAVAALFGQVFLFLASRWL